MAVGTGIVINSDANLLAANGGHIDLTKQWAKYLLSRMGFIKRRVNTKAKFSVKHFNELKKLFLLEFNNVVEWMRFRHNTGINYIPVSSWTMEEEGSKRVAVASKDDKQQLTALFAGSMSGDFLPIQLVYQGKQLGVYQSISFLQTGDIAFTPNHWCNESTMCQYIDKIILPYLCHKRKEPEQPAVMIFDNFKGQCTEELLKFLDSNNINVILIPPNCTDRLHQYIPFTIMYS